ncbi:DUF3800 domain-containing protein [Persicobacter diffluens]|uniref:DUF3800 domain-containing protein n=1 Tax=Persicobacter diffluens TaxID=981 RepID=A0AAN5AQ67_9BACT|nr:hypothetical protein PEDI_55430 [Persicobacter diffluens]
MSKTFNIYCDESSHLENDHKQFMVLGSVSSAYNQVKRHHERIKELKKKHRFYAEIKWSNVSSSQYEFYKELLEYFFDTDLKFRAVMVNKHQIRNEDYGQSYDDFYYKMYYQLLNHKINSTYFYNVYLDIKDTLSAYKVNKLKEILNTKYGVFRNVQNIRSHESILLQLADVISGLLSYHHNDADKKVKAKTDLIKLVQKHCDHDLNGSSPYGEEKVNLFFIDLK